MPSDSEPKEAQPETSSPKSQPNESSAPLTESSSQKSPEESRKAHIEGLVTTLTAASAPICPPSGNPATLTGFGASELRHRAGNRFSDGSLAIRTFDRKDQEGVQRICFNHMRSLCLAAVRYYIAEHFQDLTVLTFLGFWFLKLRELILIMLLFNLYLFTKSRYEMELYIKTDCPDLRDIHGTYLSSGNTSHFWVAELKKTKNGSVRLSENPRHSEKARLSRNSVEEEMELVGCIGVVPSRENPEIAKLVRLVVEGSHRRQRIGSRLLLQLEHYACENGFVAVRIYTNTLNPSHMKFVRQHGYTIIQVIRRGLMRGDLIVWVKYLKRNSMRQSEANEIVQFTVRSAAQNVMD